MKIIQLLPTLAFGDAVGNDTLALMQVIEEMGYETGIYAESIDQRLKDKRIKPAYKIPYLKPEDILIYHMSIGSQLTYEIENYHCKKMMIYHNVTPAEFPAPYNPVTAEACREGIEQVKYLSDKFDYCLADSEFNKQELIRMGYTCKIDVLPILIPFDDYKKTPSKKVLRRFKDDYVNILFTGRIAANKKQEDVIKTFYYYKKYINPKSRLFLVGSYYGMENYYHSLKAYVERLELEDVYFTGHISFADILAYYQLADIFLCMSEHEGFCVPLAEAMAFEIPIIAYDSSAIAGTLGGSGLLLKEKDFKVAAEMIHRIVTDEQLRADLIYNQNIRLKDFEHDVIKEQFQKYIKDFSGE